MAQDEPLINLMVKCDDGRNSTSGMSSINTESAVNFTHTHAHMHASVLPRFEKWVYIYIYIYRTTIQVSPLISHLAGIVLK